MGPATAHLATMHATPRNKDFLQRKGNGTANTYKRTNQLRTGKAQLNNHDVVPNLPSHGSLFHGINDATIFGPSCKIKYLEGARHGKS